MERQSRFRNAGDAKTTQFGGNLGGFDDNVVPVGLFFTPLVGSALWGYLLS